MCIVIRSWEIRDKTQTLRSWFLYQVKSFCKVYSTNLSVEPRHTTCPAKGHVAGWGMIQKSLNYQEIPRKLKILIHASEHCWYTEPKLLAIFSNRFFCAGKADDIGNRKCDRSIELAQSSTFKESCQQGSQIFHLKYGWLFCCIANLQLLS